MANNKRTYWPVQAVGFAPLGRELRDPSGYLAAKGVQSVGVDTEFVLEQAYQLGQLALYENIEDLPNVEITAEKVIDGYSLLQHLATPGATASSLAGRYNDNRSMTVVSYYNTSLNDAASGNPLTHLLMSGVYLSSISFSFPLEGNGTESVTLVCNDKEWFAAPSGSPWASGNTELSIGGPFDNAEAPLASGGVHRRENLIMTGAAGERCLWPTEIPGINVSGLNETDGDSYTAHIQTINISTNLNRNDLFEQGRKAPYFRYAEFPTEVTCSIETTASESGDFVNAKQNQDNLTDQTIFLYMSAGITIDLGTKNKLSSVNIAGGDTGGGNVTATYNYSTFNDLKVLASGDPAGLTS